MTVSYMEVIRARYEKLGYNAYRWFHADSEPAFNTPRKLLSESRLGMLSTSGAYALGQTAYHYKDDASVREIPSDTPASDLRFSHITENYLVDPRRDPDCIFPLSTLRGLAERGIIKELADTVLSCMGGVYSQRRVREELAPSVLDIFRRQQIDCALLVAM